MHHPPSLPKGSGDDVTAEARAHPDGRRSLRVDLRGGRVGHEVLSQTRCGHPGDARTDQRDRYDDAATLHVARRGVRAAMASARRLAFAARMNSRAVYATSMAKT